ncbi:Pam16-domain-containing protein [Annulohypoxylon truncatum]|uniref:Pam16-domain-containing protein n=1 Tax=Annulohypoxylon truncatum TaxID=327061 RepID=UPI002008718D|nr:Pam16-domain-containing protein [Annulohypoxylon truncatum]KAI1211237.1 Pam16-domain-containing protein [Annulohypoxylon truncatum]
MPEHQFRYGLLIEPLSRQFSSCDDFLFSQHTTQENPSSPLVPSPDILLYAFIERAAFCVTALFHYITKMAHRIITQIVLVGSRVLGRAFAEAYKQAQASSNYARAQAKINPNAPSARASLSSGMTLDEACRILNVKPPQGGKADMEEVMSRFKKLFDQNDPEKGGSFYLQSKILRARERIEAEVRPAMEKAAQEAEIKEGFKPKVYKDR